MSAALWTESVKLLRSRTPWVTSVAFLLPVLLACVFMNASSEGGLLGGKAQVLGITPDWAGFHATLMQVDAAGGFLLFGTVLAWTFGREFSERTALDLLALPTSRGAIVVAKFIVAAGWLLAISALQVAAWLIAGGLLGLPGTYGHGLGSLVILLVFNIVLAFPVALASSAGRGYLPGIGASAAVVIGGVASAAAGIGAWFPWTIPALVSGLMGAPSQVPYGIAIVAATGLAGITLTITWWKTADHAL